jgi:NAD(P)-dependent dehydrogenase (short-subunit alcohol dehydrogenase family)
MIARIWRGVVRLEDATSTPITSDTGFTEYAETSGNRGAWMLRRDQGDRTEFLTLSLWDSLTRSAAPRRTEGLEPNLDRSSSAAGESRHQMGGFDLACAAIEAFTRSLAEEVGGQGVRVVAVRPNFTPETNPGVPEEALQPLVKDTLLRRLPRLAEVAGAAVFAASEEGGAMTGAVVNLTCGAIVD